MAHKQAERFSVATGTAIVCFDTCVAAMKYCMQENCKLPLGLPAELIDRVTGEVLTERCNPVFTMSQAYYYDQYER